MAKFEADQPDVESARLAQLEARVEALERALALLVPAQPVVPFDLDKTQPMSMVDAPAARATPPPRSSLQDRLEMTDSFAALDSVVADAAKDELRLLKSRTFKGPVVIDESLIDTAHARPPPEKLDVKAWLEELHPKIAERVVLTWRTPELLQYLQKLIVDERGDRAGFAPGVMSELLLLSAILEAPSAMLNWDANGRVI